MHEALVIEQVVKDYAVRGRGIAGQRSSHRAVDEVSFSVSTNETVALVGQSGSGKTTLGRMILGLETPTSGRILVAGHDVTRRGAALREARRYMQMVFQDPYESIDSRMTIVEAVEEPLRAERGLSARTRRERALEMLELVELTPVERFAARRPYELSGGQRQRVAIARAMISRPRLVVADEPVSMLDVSIRANTLNLFQKLQDEMGVSYLFITHDLMVAQHIADRVAVMTEGKIVEFGDAHAVMNDPQHEYTRMLLDAAPRLPQV